MGKPEAGGRWGTEAGMEVARMYMSSDFTLREGRSELNVYQMAYLVLNSV